MDNVLNRPLFRRREARDRLNEMAGVQGFQEGGAVRPAGLPSARELAAEQTGSMIRSGLSSLADRTAGALSAAGSGLYGLSADVLSPAFATLGATSLAAQLERQSDIAYNIARSNLANGLSATEGMSPADFDMEPAQFDFVVAKAEADARKESETRKAETAPPGPRAVPRPAGTFARPEAPAAGMPAAPALGPSVMEQEARARGAAPQAPAPRAPALGPSDMEAEARARGPLNMGPSATAPGPLITNPDEVAAGLNAPEPEVRERTAKDFMQEFMANAPQYQGADKGLMHAMIGFAIASGDSPNAMTNIAQGLQAGAQMFLQDKAAKDEFDRQLQLSAMQYGLQESTKQRDRGRQPLTFVAMEDTTYKGRPVRAGEQVYIPYSEIERNGGMAPPGFGDTALAAAMIERQKSVMESINKAYEDRLIDDSQLSALRNDYSAATRNAMAAQRGIDYMEAAILKVGEEGSITGIKGSVDALISKVAAAAGIDDLSAEYGDRGQAVDMVKIAFQNLIPSALSGVQTANSISNRDIELLANAYVDSMLENGVFSMSNITEDKLLRSMKGALDLLQTGRQQSLTDMTAIEQQLGGRYLRSGNAGSPVLATSVIEPYRALVPNQGEIGVPSQFGSLYLSEDGVYDIMRPGG